MSSPHEDSQPTDQFMQVTAYWCPLYLPWVFMHFFPPSVCWCMTTNSPWELSYAGVRQYMVLPFQVQKVCQANINMILKALEVPNMEMKELIKQQRSHYETKYSYFLMVSFLFTPLFFKITFL